VKTLRTRLFSNSCKFYTTR